MSPTLGGLPNTTDTGPRAGSLLDLPHVQLVSQGRAAISLALLHWKIGHGDEVLLPAFNCPAMTAGIEASGATPRFFPIREDLIIDPQDVLASGSARTRAVIIPHLFMRRQPGSLFDALRASERWLLIEDCAHSFFADSASPGMGSDGDVVIGSVAKFFPSRWGGLLGSSRQMMSLPLDPSTAAWQLKLMANSAEEAAEFGSLGSLMSPLVARSLGLVTALRRGRRAKAAEGGSVASQDATVDLAFSEVDRGRLHEEAGWWVRRAMGPPESFAKRAHRRVAVYRRLSSALCDLKAGRLLDGYADPDFPPYVLPLELSFPNKHFGRLRAQGVPLYRWEHSPKGYCAVADRYRQSLVQLPCHDSMTDATCDAIAAAVRRALDA